VACLWCPGSQRASRGVPLAHSVPLVVCPCVPGHQRSPPGRGAGPLADARRWGAPQPQDAAGEHSIPKHRILKKEKKKKKATVLRAFFSLDGVHPNRRMLQVSAKEQPLSFPPQLQNNVLKERKGEKKKRPQNIISQLSVFKFTCVCTLLCCF